MGLFSYCFKKKRLTSSSILSHQRGLWVRSSLTQDLSGSPLPSPIDKFPFVFKHAPKAPAYSRFFPPSKDLKPLTYVFDSLQSIFATYSSYSSAEVRFGKDYWPNEFSIGATYAIGKFFQLLKEPRSRLSEIMTEDLLVLLDEYIRKDNDEPLRLQPYIRLKQVYNSKIRAVYVNFGCKDTFKCLSELEKSNVKDPRYIRIRWKTFNIGLKLTSYEKDVPSSFSGIKNLSIREMKKGVSYAVDLEIDGEFETGYFDFLDGKNENILPKIVNKEKRTIVVTFQSQHCNPACKLSVEDVYDDDELVKEGVEWKISDIDYVIFEKRLRDIENFEKG
ncbi:hypothetical protein T552_02014 [Pneumocystis carinii B80]|uniref:Uncharacterized protein n=1 Tax=Pneumocystis carinii (strain B80) TaxID=1408658 RepID=A0A0W4ZIF6_PNEC8|nr:hypothetical protein T552_02014 [Pneumocystis carinii B80]KTW28155.1 hypothetical protein T552_02014 [Pneumocystis carinii B80]